MTTLDQKSKLLAFILRHKPESVGAVLDSEGWVEVHQMLAGIAATKGGNQEYFTLQDLTSIVETDNKGRYVTQDFNGVLKVRAVHGHSVDIKTGTIKQPPDSLYHGTATRFVDSISEKGIIRGSRQHVHLSESLDDAVDVGSRHGKPIVMLVAALDMFKAGHVFYISDSGIWLTESVPPEFIVAHLEVE